MDDMKDKVKGFMKKMNNSFSSSSSSSSSGKFKGQSRVLGSSSSSDGSNPITSPPSQTYNPNPSRLLAAQSNSKPLPKTSISNRKVENNSEIPKNNVEQTRKPASGFDPYDSLITSGKRNAHGYELNVFECPICSRVFGSEEEVSNHVESCLSSTEAYNKACNEEVEGCNSSVEVKSELETCVSAYSSGKPSPESLEIVLKLLRNIVREPENAKFRKIRLGNPKIKEAVVNVVGGMELLECVGFELKEEGVEMWAIMEAPSFERISSIKNAILFLEPEKVEDLPSTAPVEVEEPAEKKKVDRQIRVFFAVTENIAAKIELPDSFYNLSVVELKREADVRKKKIAESQLLIPKSYKEKQAKAAKKHYNKTIIRVQFPDGVVLQGIFAPWEPTSALYEFVSTALKEPCLEFELLHPVVVRRRIIPSFPAAGERATTMEEEDLVPAALVKFRPIETDSIVFTGLRNELLEISEPLL